MVTIMQNRLTPDASVTPNDIRKDMARAGYTKMATSLSLESLKRKGMIEFDESAGDFNGNTWPVVRLSEKGVDWILENQDRFQLSIVRDTDQEVPETSDEDIPF